ncbi:hypothetical protein NPIL_17941 [Nephila pilipes]|uniref:Uncharacterized protein n=1 Tax=Nephila pilipes TaxID=299642 RepID=A0A8X6MYU1_NEPPI|nr:hypothetical protein NPIL_17941 [Nephila pilipes]
MDLRKTVCHKSTEFFEEVSENSRYIFSHAHTIHSVLFPSALMLILALHHFAIELLSCHTVRLRRWKEEQEKVRVREIREENIVWLELLTGVFPNRIN